MAIVEARPPKVIGCRFDHSRKARRGILAIPGMFESNLAFRINDQFKTESMCFLSRLIDGFYPEYRRLVPTETDFQAEFEAQDLINALKRVTTISKDQNCGVNLTLSRGSMKLEVLTAGQGRADDEIPLVFDHDDFKVRYGVRNLLNVLELMSDSRWTLSCVARGACNSDSKDLVRSILYCRHYVRPAFGSNAPSRPRSAAASPVNPCRKFRGSSCTISAVSGASRLTLTRARRSFTAPMAAARPVYSRRCRSVRQDAA